MKTRIKFFVLFISLIPGLLGAADIKRIPTNESNFFTISGLPQQRQWTWKCRLIIFCWPSRVLGATITTINATDQISASRAVINTNFTNLNTDKIEVATTSIGNITTLSNLVSIGTITTGVWTGTAIRVASGGTGTTSPAQYQVILGNSSYGLTVASSTGTSGQFLTSNGAGLYPTWQTSAVSLTDDYTWTGNHIFKGRATTTGPTFLNTVSVATSSPGSTTQFTIASSTYIDNGGLGVGRATTTDNNVEIAGDIQLTGALLANFYLKNMVATTTAAGADICTTANCSTSVTATCPQAMWAIAGGARIQGGFDVYALLSSFSPASTTWTGVAGCRNGAGTCTSGSSLLVTAYCIKP